jgi:hypothetical protein
LHPLYINNLGDWAKFRDTYAGGKSFVYKYLTKYSERESTIDFTSRKEITYCPAYAKAALNDVKNSIYQRMADIKRLGGPKSYQDAILGTNGGVDGNGNTMTSYMGGPVLQDLLVIKKVGIFVDKAPMPQYTTMHAAPRPYLYTYPAEQIENWDFEGNTVTKAHLVDTVTVYDDEGFPCTNSTRTRKLWLTHSGVEFWYKLDGEAEVTGTLPLSRLPLIIGELSASLLEDIADYQIALLNIESSDINYIIKANHVFYTEMYDPAAEASHLKQGAPGTDDTSATKREVDVGSLHGRRYPKGFDRPEFIAPPGGPLEASMAKQMDIRAGIRYLINLNISNLQARATSADSKGMDDRSLEAGLSCIGQELERMERLVSDIWAEYEGRDTPATISYPKIYTIKSFDQALDEAGKIEDRMKGVPSPTFKKEMAKTISRTLLGNNVTNDTIITIEAEIDRADILNTDPETIVDSYEKGLLPGEMANKALGYPDDAYVKAKADHAERLKRIQAAQKPHEDGVGDTSVAPAQNAIDEKTRTQQTDVQEQPTKPVRGEGAT